MNILLLIALFLVGTFLTSFALQWLLAGGVTAAAVAVALILNSVLIFGLPGFVAWRVGVGRRLWLKKGECNFSVLFSTFLIVLICQPLIQWAGFVNEHICQWEPFASLNALVDANSDQFFAQVLNFDSLWGWLVALTIVALLPALCEEFFFRGALMSALRRISGSWHWAVVISAVVFSTLHLEADAFLPRLLLGGILGTLFALTRSIWPSVLFHFVNNAAVVITIGLSAEPVEKLMAQPIEDPGIFMPIVALALTYFELRFIAFICGRMPIQLPQLPPDANSDAN